MDYCKKCDRSAEELAAFDVAIDNDGYCEDCLPKQMNEWLREKIELERFWRDTRL